MASVEGEFEESVDETAIELLTTDNNKEVSEVVEEQKEKLLQLPMGRVRHIIKTDPDVNLVNQEAVFLIGKSTELFIESLAKEACKYTTQMKRKTVQKRDVDQAVNNVDILVFLEGALE